MTEVPSENTQLHTQAHGNNEVRLSRPRLPYHPAIEDKFGIDRGSWKFLTDVLYPTAEEPETIINVLAYCKARKLDVMKKPVHVVPVWDKKRKKMVDSVWPAISEVRITAMRTGEYVGKGETIFGPEVTETLGGVEITYPKFAQLTVYRLVAGMAREFQGEKLLWKEFYAKAGRDTAAPNDMWKTKPFKQLAKCAEADALRAAFPEEAGTDQTAEEMAGQEVEHVYSAGEEITTSGVRARLQQKSDKPEGDFNTQVLETLGDDNKPEPPPEKPKRGRPSKAEIAAREAAERAAAGQKPEGPSTATTELPSEPETASDAEFEPIDPQDPNAWMVLAEIDGPAPAGEEYTLLEDEPVNGKLNVYRDSVVIGTIGPEDSGSYNAYDSHPATEDDAFPGDKPFSKIAAGLQDAIAIADGTADPETYRIHHAKPQLTGAFARFWDDYIVTEVSQWATIKDALRLLQATQDYKDLTPVEQNAWRKIAWTAIDEKIAAGELEIDVLDDITAFRYWTETQDDPESLVAKYAELQDMALYEGLQQNLKDALDKAVAERIAVLEAP